MAKFYGKDTYLVHKEFRYFALSLMVILIPVALVFLALRYGSAGLTILAALAVLLLLLIIIKPLSDYLNLKGLQFYRGDFGEKQVRKVLKKLPDDFSVFEDVRIGDKKGNIDFIVVGPTGLFLLEVKSFAGVVEFDGQVLTLNGKVFGNRNFLRQVHGEVWALKQFLDGAGRSPFIHSVLVFSNKRARLNFGLQTVENVYIVHKDFLPELFFKLPSYQYPLSRELLETKLRGVSRP